MLKKKEVSPPLFGYDRHGNLRWLVGFPWIELPLILFCVMVFAHLDIPPQASERLEVATQSYRNWSRSVDSYFHRLKTPPPAKTRREQELEVIEAKWRDELEQKRKAEDEVERRRIERRDEEYRYELQEFYWAQSKENGYIKDVRERREFQAKTTVRFWGKQGRVEQDRGELGNAIHCYKKSLEVWPKGWKESSRLEALERIGKIAEDARAAADEARALNRKQ